MVYVEAIGKKWISENTGRLLHGDKTILQIEVDRIEQLQRALPLSPNIILLDNMSPSVLKQSVHVRDETAPAVQLEASGGVNLESVGKIAQTLYPTGLSCSA